MDAIASRLVVVAAIGSLLHSGAPTSAASGITTSAPATRRRISSSSRTSPFTTEKFGSAQHEARLFCFHMKLSTTVTRWPAASRAGTRIEPR
jgi:hypothetical protein